MLSVEIFTQHAKCYHIRPNKCSENKCIVSLGFSTVHVLERIVVKYPPNKGTL